MAVCAQLYTSLGRTYLTLGSGDPSSCGLVVLSSTEYQSFLTNLTAFGFDQDLFAQAFMAGLLMFSISFGVGVVIANIRKLRVR